MRHIMEGVFESGLIPGLNADDAWGHGILFDAKRSGNPSVCDLKAAWAKCESPIEKAMASALCYAPWPSEVVVEPQHVIGNYRLDFLASCPGASIDIECDGVDFHYHGISWEAYQRDRARDAYVRSQNIEVIRFKGTEIWANAIGCAHEVTELMRDLLGESK